MATTINPSTLKVTLEALVTLGGVEYKFKHTKSISDVTEVDHRIVDVGTTEVEVLAFQATNPGSGTFNEDDVRIIILANLDNTNFIQLILKNESNDECVHKLDAGHITIIAGDNDGGVKDIHDAENGAISTVTFADLVNITALADTAACNLELFVAGV
jgi:hypothetical protein